MVQKIDCWKTIEELRWVVPAELERELVPITRGRHVRQDAAEPDSAIAGSGEDEPIREAAKISSETWFRLSHWAAATGELQSWQRSLAYSLGQRAAANTAPTLKQATQGLLALEEALRLGFE